MEALKQYFEQRGEFDFAALLEDMEFEEVEEPVTH